MQLRLTPLAWYSAATKTGSTKMMQKSMRSWMQNRHQDHISDSRKKDQFQQTKQLVQKSLCEMKNTWWESPKNYKLKLIQTTKMPSMMVPELYTDLKQTRGIFLLIGTLKRHPKQGLHYFGRGNGISPTDTSQHNSRYPFYSSRAPKGPEADNVSK